MKLFPEDPEFEIGKVGFEGSDAQGRKFDLLGRKPLGQKLTELVDRINQPLVIALDGGWGSGKSHFLKLWAGAHSLELGGKAEVIYFDAFEHDFLDDPLVSLVSRLVVQGEAKSWSEATLAKMKKAAFPLTRGLLRTGVALATAGISEAAGPVIDALAGKIGDATEDQIDGFWQQETGRIAAMTQFKKALQALTLPKADGEGMRKIVFIVDELDRCRPDYALSLLEIIKHFFAVPNVHFVLGVNLESLNASVCRRYGVWVGSGQYLQKFIHLTLNFPVDRDHLKNGAWMTYFDVIAKRMGAPQMPRVTEMLSLYGGSNAIHLRDVQRFLTRLALLPDDLHNTTNSYRILGLSALILQVFAPAKYAALRSNTLTIEDITNMFPIPAKRKATYRLAVRLNHLWRRVLLENPGEETIRETENELDFTVADDASAHFDRFWRETFDELQIPERS